MCAMMPMLRSLARAASAAATVIPTSSRRRQNLSVLPSLTSGCNADRLSAPRSPSVVREGLVRLGHLVRVLAPLDGGSEAVARVEQLVLQSLDHRLLPPGLGVLDEPAQPERCRPRWAHLNRHLVGRATDAAA